MLPRALDILKYVVDSLPHVKYRLGINHGVESTTNTRKPLWSAKITSELKTKVFSPVPPAGCQSRQLSINSQDKCVSLGRSGLHLAFFENWRSTFQASFERFSTLGWL